MAARAHPHAAPATCLHCDTPLASAAGSAFCCRGCEEVHGLLAQAGLARYYELGGRGGFPVQRAHADHAWLEPVVAAAKESVRAAGVAKVVLDVQGLHCAACVWLFEQTFARGEAAYGVVVDPALGAATLTFGEGFDLGAWITTIESFGYRLGPPLKAGTRGAQERGDLVWRMGVCIAIAMNAMIFGFAIYAGLEDGPVARLFHALDFGLALASVVIGGTVFFRSAWQALVRRVLHLDLPIALGILLAFGSSVHAYFLRGGGSSYFDTLTVFIALMLVGRFLQERVVARNRAYLLAEDGTSGLLCRRMREDGRTELAPARTIEQGDLLVLGREDLVPVDAELVGPAEATFSLDWVSGESAPRTFAAGDRVPAGAFCRDARAALVRALTPFDTSAIVHLLRTSKRRDGDVARSTPFWRSLTRVYVLAVLSVAMLGGAGFYLVTRDAARTVDVLAAVLIVTCPCAFGIATPLAYELAQASLRRRGLFVRTPGFLDRAVDVRRVYFDKTGTLTTGELALADMRVLDRLDAASRRRLGELAVRSSHPKSRAVVRALEARGEPPTFDAAVDAEETPGKGLELRAEGAVYRLGQGAWATAGARTSRLTTARGFVFAKNGEVLATLETREDLRPDAESEVRALSRDGYEVTILSGDTQGATSRVAIACGIPRSRAHGGQTPEAKASYLRDRPGSAAEALFIGDGINDSLVAEEALAAGTPAIDRPFMAARCDFYFVTPGLGPIRAALETARLLRRVVRTNLAIAVAYNLITVSLALFGLMTPLLCAVVMPISSLSTVLATSARFARGVPERSARRLPSVP